MSNVAFLDPETHNDMDRNDYTKANTTEKNVKSNSVHIQSITTGSSSFHKDDDRFDEIIYGN